MKFIRKKVSQQGPSFKETEPFAQGLPVSTTFSCQAQPKILHPFFPPAPFDATLGIA
jgi:hypothetical protein